jgi:hypothetical protein
MSLAISKLENVGIVNGHTKAACPAWLAGLNRIERAELLRSLRFVDKIGAEGLLVRVTLPGRKTAIGFDAASVEKLFPVEGRTP